MGVFRRIWQIFCGVVIGHEPRVENIGALWGKTRWCKVCRRCRRILEVL